MLIRSIGLLCLLGVFVSCESSAVRDYKPRFAITPFGEKTSVAETYPQKGRWTAVRISRKNFSEATIAQGSGRDGFDSIRVFADGNSYATVVPPGKVGRRVLFDLSEGELAGLITAMNADQIGALTGGYSVDIHDGTQGFIEMKGGNGRVFSWFNNHFEPLSHTYDYCNRVIWPKVDSGKLSELRIDPQDEYYRASKF